MIEDTFVIDAVVHGYCFATKNRKHEVAGKIGEYSYKGLHVGLSPRNQPYWLMERERFIEAGDDPDLVGHALFAESQTDVAIHHGVGIFGAFKEGIVPPRVGIEMRDRYPNRVLVYGPVSPGQPDVLDEIDRMVEEDGIVGIKLYPLEIEAGQMVPHNMSDPDKLFPIYERAQKRGIKTIAIHKALPLGPAPITPFTVTDLEGAVTAFPDLTFEIVHGGMAFLEETALQVVRYPNVVINLEGGANLIINSPRKFAELLGTFMAAGGAERIVYATGCMAQHPRPIIETFWNFKMPEDLMGDYGFPQVTKEDKKKILGENIARILGLDIGEMKQKLEDDPYGLHRETFKEPWSGASKPLPSEAAA